MKRLKAILKWMAIGIAVLIAIALLYNAYYVATTGAKLASRLENLRKAGEPVQLTDLARKPVLAEENAATFFGRSTADMKQMNREIESAFPDGFNGMPTLTDEDREKLAKVFAAYPQVVPQLTQAADCSVYDWQLDYSLPHTTVISNIIEQVGDQRAAARILRAHAALLVASGQHEEAFADALMMLRLSRLSMQESCMIQYLVGCAIKGTAIDAANQVLQTGTISAESRKALVDELDKHDVFEEFAHGLKTERAAVLTGIDELPGAKYWISRGMVNDGKLRLLDLFERILADGSLDPADAIAASSSGKKTGSLSVYVVLIDQLLSPAVEASANAMKRNLASVRALQILNAIQSQHPSEEEVPSLESLGLEPGEVIDPFSGKPMVVRKLPEGWLIYSVGHNRTDEEGKISTGEDVGVSPLPVPQKAKSPYAP